MSTLPRISLVTPSFNQAAFLGTTILSVLSQGYPDLQYGVVDGGSTDGSVAIIRRYAERLDYAVVEPDRGQSQAINKGFVRADGQIVGWLCSDDTLVPGALHVVGRYFADHPDCDWLAGAVVHIDTHNNALQVQRPHGDFSLAGILLRPDGLSIPQPAVFWRRRLLNEVGLLDESLHYAMDFDLWCRLAATGRRPHLIDTPLATYRMHPASKSCSAKSGFLRDHIAIESRMARLLPLRQRLRMARRLGTQKRALAIATAPSPGALWRAALARPWWLGSIQIRQALTSRAA